MEAVTHEHKWKPQKEPSMYSRIVVPLDGSELAAHALPAAEEMARSNDAPLHLLRVVEFGRLAWTGKQGPPATVVASETDAAEAYLTDVRNTIVESGLEVTTEVRRGSSGHELVDAVQPGDLLVMTSHGRSGAPRWFLGSVAENVIRHSPVPVMLVRAGDHPAPSPTTSVSPPAHREVEPAVTPSPAEGGPEEIEAFHGEEEAGDVHRMPVGLGLGIGVSTESQDILGEFTFADEIAQFVPGEAPNERRAETLIKTDSLRVVLVSMSEGITLHEHSAPGPITIQTLRGRFTVSVGDKDRDIPAGSMIVIAAGARHAVKAVEEGAFLLTIAWPQRAPEVPDVVVHS